MGKPCCFCGFLPILQRFTQATVLNSTHSGTWNTQKKIKNKKWFVVFFFLFLCGREFCDTGLTCSQTTVKLVMWPRISILLP